MVQWVSAYAASLCSSSSVVRVFCWIMFLSATLRFPHCESSSRKALLNGRPLVGCKFSQCDRRALKIINSKKSFLELRHILNFFVSVALATTYLALKTKMLPFLDQHLRTNYQRHHLFSFSCFTPGISFFFRSLTLGFSFAAGLRVPINQACHQRYCTFPLSDPRGNISFGPKLRRMCCRKASPDRLCLSSQLTFA